MALLSLARQVTGDATLIVKGVGCGSSFRKLEGCCAKNGTIWLAILPPAPKGERQPIVKCIVWDAVLPLRSKLRYQ